MPIEKPAPTRGHTCHWPGCPQEVPPADQPVVPELESLETGEADAL